MLGKPEMTVVAFGSNEVDIYKVNDVMTSRGWSLNALQRPARSVVLDGLSMLTFLRELKCWSTSGVPTII